MKKRYENPTINLTYVDDADILTTSGDWADYEGDDKQNDPYNEE